MAYERQYYTNGDVLDARQMNHMETGIKENSDNIDKHSRDIATKASAIKEKASGEVIVVTDSDEAKPLGLAIDGKSEQNQYSGKNKLDARLNVDIKSNDTYKIYNIKPNTVYTLSLSQMLVALGTNTTAQHQFVFYDEADNILTRGAVANMVFASVGEVIEKIATISAPENASYLQIDLGTYFGSSASSTVKTLYAQLEEGSVATEIEPYVGGQPSPNPSYPQEIRNTGKYDEASGKYAVEVKGTGKNLIENTIESITTGGITFTKNEDGSVTLNGTSTNIIMIARYNTGKLKAGKYILSGCPSGGSGTTYLLRVRKWSDESNSAPIGGLDIGSGCELTLTEDTENISFAIHVAGVGVVCNNITFEPMLRPVGTDDTYEPYKETTATVLLPQPLRKGDNAYWNGEKMLVERNRRISVLNGTENYSHSTAWTNECSFSSSNVDWNPKLISGYATESSMICDNLRVKTPSYVVDNKENVIGQGGSDGKSIFISIDGITTAEDLKAYLAENPIELEYDFAEPITEEIDLPLDLSMFYPTTIISNDCNANMEVTYIADTKNYIDKLKAKHESDITALKTAIVALGGTV